MVYIVFVNPQILGVAGMDTSAVFVTTCLIAAFGSIMMGLFANLPVALAPAMGLNAFFAFVVVQAMGLPWQVGMGAIFWGGGWPAAVDDFPRTLLDDRQYPG
ncbi:xanthine/uracil/thiamine/ascorbate permease family protein [Klebsiella michiganensis]|uniref:Xanthine/uracil/thiamine/ascorbate permease family protein n=1 Tax=Klebsiella michiganensis TaxID=1134687 RepID=A0A7H4PEV2_9ENTR|nr:xanthine/uracil/thiamine/ascorbate permease family protein [Klebsiella michiganensis]